METVSTRGVTFAKNEPERAPNRKEAVAQNVQFTAYTRPTGFTTGILAFLRVMEIFWQKPAEKPEGDRKGPPSS